MPKEPGHSDTASLGFEAWSPGCRDARNAAVIGAAIGVGIAAVVASCSADKSEFSAKLAELPGVLNVYFLAGPVDFWIHVSATTTDDLRNFVTTHLSASREYATTETSLIFEHVRGEQA